MQVEKKLFIDLYNAGIAYYNLKPLVINAYLYY